MQSEQILALPTDVNYHAEMGEEIFEALLEPESENVIYRIQAVSKPRAALARIVFPHPFFQERFRRDSLSGLRERSARNLIGYRRHLRR